MYYSGNLLSKQWSCAETPVNQIHCNTPTASDAVAVGQPVDSTPGVMADFQTVNKKQAQRYQNTVLNNRGAHNTFSNLWVNLLNE